MITQKVTHFLDLLKSIASLDKRSTKKGRNQLLLLQLIKPLLVVCNQQDIRASKVRFTIKG